VAELACSMQKPVPLIPRGSLREQMEEELLHYICVTAFFRTTWVSCHQKVKPFWILLEQEMMGWQWNQLDHMQIICTLLQTENHASISPLKCFTGQMPFLVPN